MAGVLWYTNPKNGWTQWTNGALGSMGTGETPTQGNCAVYTGSDAQRVHSGLTAAVIKSSTTPEQAANGLLNYIRHHVPERGVALLAGNSVHADRAFLRKEPYKPILDHLHYRILDVSSVKEAARRWCPRVASATPAKKGMHKAKEDILESIEEAKYYKRAIFQAAEIQ